MSWGRRAKSPGWAAFDQRQKQKHDPEARISGEPFPSLPTSIPSLQPCSSHVRNTSSKKPFASAALPSVSFPAQFVDKRSISSHATFKADNSRRRIASNDPQGMEPGGASRRLKLMYSWADDSLIEDILAAVDNDFEKASSSLKAMVSDDSRKECNNPDSAVSLSNLQFLTPEGKTLQSNVITSSKTTDPSEPTSISVSCIGDGNPSAVECNRASDELLLTGSPSISVIPGQLTGAPLEPEWEEDDVYFNHRKDAIKIIRAASRHSKAAANSFIRGDHLSARHYSQKAREEWEAAEKLHQKAANEILRIRNDKNGIWKLDLHGLHAVEAVQALKDRLSVIETQVGSAGSAHSAYAASNTEVQHGLPCGIDEPLMIRQRPVSLEVITGIGNHSRGEAAIPAAVKGFLIDNGYRHEEARPGLIMVRPKFRQR